jgi:hypothetical protein
MSVAFNTIFGQFKINWGPEEEVPPQETHPAEASPAEPAAQEPSQAASVATVPEEHATVASQQLPPAVEEKAAKEPEHETNSQVALAPSDKPVEPPAELAKKDAAEAPAAAPEEQQTPSVQQPEEKKLPGASLAKEAEQKAPAAAESKRETKEPVPGSVHREVPAIPEMVRRSVEKELPPVVSVQDEWNALAESICASEAERAKVQGLLRDLWENLLPPLPEQTQKLFNARLTGLHQEVSRQLTGSDLSPKSFTDAVRQAQDGLERVIDAAHKAIDAICTPAGGQRK